MAKTIYSWIIEKCIFKLGDFALKTSFIKELENCRIINQLNEEELNSIQLKKLEELLKYASSYSTYFAKLGENLHINFDGSVDATLKQFPILTKEILRNNLDDIVTMNKKDLIVYETSGSSGKATKVYLTKAEESICRAILINWWEWCGYYLGKPYLQTGMTTKRGLVKTLKDWFTRTHYMDAFNLTDDEIVKHLNKIQNKGYHFGGYASSLYVIAQVAEQRKLDLTFDGVISWGDKMFPHYREKIERVFQTKVYENYACNEGIMVGQKVDLPYFYIYTPNVYLELLDENGNEVPDGEIGRVIITKLDGYATPLIRYETGDLAIKLPRNEYPENRKYNFPLLKMVIGRDTDIIKTPEGNRLIVHTFTGIFEFYPSIKQFRVIQNVVDEIEIEYIKTTDFEESTLNNIEKDLRDKTKTNIKIIWKEVDFIPNTKSGKPQLIQNNLIKKHNVEQE